MAYKQKIAPQCYWDGCVKNAKWRVVDSPYVVGAYCREHADCRVNELTITVSSLKENRKK